MSQYDYLGVSVQEGTEKTAETVADHFPPVANESINQSREELSYEETVGVRAPIEQQYGGVHYEGDIEGAVRPNSTAVFITSAMGPPVTTNAVSAFQATHPYLLGQVVRPATPNGHIYEVTVAGTSAGTAPTWPTTAGSTVVSGGATFREAEASDGIYDHIWDPTAVNKAPVPLTIWTVNQDLAPAIVDKYIGSYVNELGFSVETNGYFTFAASIVALLLDDAASPPALTRDLSFKFAYHQITAEISVAGATLEPLALENWNFSYNNNYETDIYRLGSREPQTFRPGNIESTSEMRPVEFVATHYRRALLRTPEFVRVRIVAVGETLAGSGVGAMKEEVEVDVKRLQYIEAPVDIDASAVLTGVDVTANAVVDPTNQLVTVRMRNSNPGTTYAPAP